YPTHIRACITNWNYRKGEPAHKKEVDKKKRPWWKRGLRILGRTFLVLFIILILLILFIRSPWGQNIIVGKITQYVSDKTHTEVAIKKLFITFSGAIDIQGLYLEDTKGDTLLYSEELRAAIPLWPIIKGEPISINHVKWKGLRANVIQKDSTEGFNYQFLIDAFVSDTTEVDTTRSEPPKIAVGTLDFSDFKLNYEDDVSGMKARLRLGKMHFKGKHFDLENSRFEVAELALENTSLSYEQTKSLPENNSEKTEDTDTTETSLPFLSVDELSLKNVSVHYKSAPDGMQAD